MHQDVAIPMNSSPDARFRQTLQSFEQDWTVTEASLRTLYHPDIKFTDPLITVQGRDRFVRANHVMVRSARSICVDIQRVVTETDHLFATWTFTLTPKFGPTLRIEGCTHARWQGDQIIKQRDYWDIVGSITTSLPGVAWLNKWRRERFSPAS